jgi:hypothetical protein
MKRAVGKAIVLGLTTLTCTSVVGGEMATPARLDLTVAATYPVVEPDWRELLARRVKEAERLGLFEVKRQALANELRRRRERPVTRPLPAARERRHTQRPLYDEDALAALPEATQAALTALHRRYVLFDGDSLAQRVWAVKELAKAPSRAVVATGSMATPEGLLRRLDGTRRADPTRGVRLWADQGGVLARRFGIAALPALVEVTGRTVRVTEVPVAADAID